MFVFPPAGVEQLGYQWSDFRESSFFSIFGKSVGEIQV
jgi:hypothetical protein